MTTKKQPTLMDEDYIPDALTVVRPVDQELDTRLTGQAAVEVLATALRDAAWEFDPDDLMTITAADTLAVVDADEYRRGYELLHELGELETRITSHYGRFDKPLNFLVGVVRKLKSPQVAQVTPIKQALSKRLGLWKYEQDRKDRIRRDAEQQAADLAAKAAQQARADALTRVAEIEPDPALQASFRAEAESVRAVEVHAPPVETTSTVPQVAGGYTRVPWKCEFTDVKELLRAYIDGKCFLDEDAIKKGLQTSLDKQAQSLGTNMTKAYPGTKAVPVPTGVARRK
jgi:hypothetical protein